MSQDFVRICCDEEKEFVATFAGEPVSLFCKNHFKDKALLIGASKIIKIKTGKEVKIATS